MTIYQATNYWNYFPLNQTILATPLTFIQYVSPINGFGDMLNWDFKASFLTPIESGIGSRTIFAFDGIAGATYDIFSESFFDPLFLQLLDDQGRVIAVDDFSGAYGIDHIEFMAPYDGTYYIDSSWRTGFEDTDKYSSVTVYEDLDTISPSLTRSAPSVSIFNPIHSATGVPIDSNIILTFNETIQRGTGSIFLRDAENIIIESFDSAFSNNLSFSDETLSINPTNDLENNTQYFLTVSSGSIRDLAGNGNAEITFYSFITLSQTIDTIVDIRLNIDRVFNWGETQYSHLLPVHQDSLDIFGYYARIYSNGNAIGEQNNNIYFYDGGTGDIIHIGSIADFLPYALSAGF